ncbi:MAG: hypothetical protein AB7D16_05910 [Eubacteriaceae bacterium]
MNILNWGLISSPEGQKPMIFSEYVLNDLGVFVKRERRMPKKAKLTALTGFRIGYQALAGSNYRAAALDRNAILWHKITRVISAPDNLMIYGNSQDLITLYFDQDQAKAITSYVHTMRKNHPPVKTADYDAASWLCWRDDDDWGDNPFMPLLEMIEIEKDTDRFIEPEILEETVLKSEIEIM